MSKFTTHLGVLLSLILIAAVGRLIPHPSNFTPMLSIALLASAYYSRYLACLIVIAAFVLSDALLGFASISPFIYMTIGLIAIGAHKFTQRAAENHFFRNVFFLSLGGSIAFFLISNFFVWAVSLMYPLNLTGLLSCYAAGIPFFKNTLVSTIVYSYALFGITEFLLRQHRKSALEHAL